MASRLRSVGSVNAAAVARIVLSISSRKSRPTAAGTPTNACGADRRKALGTSTSTRAEETRGASSWALSQATRVGAVRLLANELDDGGWLQTRNRSRRRHAPPELR